MGWRDFLGIETEIGPSPEQTVAELTDRLNTLEGQIKEEAIAEAASLEEVMESLSDRRADLMLQQTLEEDRSWDLVSAKIQGLLDDLEPPHENRVRRNNLAEKTWREDPVAGRSVNTLNDYVWGRGLPMPRAVDRRIQRLIRSVWDNPENQLILTSYEAQVCKGTELILFGEIFLVVFDQGSWTSEDLDPWGSEIDGEDITVSPDDAEQVGPPDGALLPQSEIDGTRKPPAELTPENVDQYRSKELSPADGKLPEPDPPSPPSAVVFGQIHPNEIAEVIPDEENQSRPRYYKRVSKRRRYNFKNEGSWDESDPAGNLLGKRIRYYEDLIYPPQEEQAAPAEHMLGVGKILHIMTNRHSFQLRGNSEMWRAVRWARSLNDFFTWRLTVLRALSTIIFKKKVKGGSAQVVQSAQRFAAGTGRTGRPGDFDPVAPPASGSLLVENQNENLEQFKTTSGAGEAEQDSQMLRGQVGVAMGLPIHYLGDKGSANLANAAAMETPVLKMMEARQELFEQAVTKILNFCIDKAIAEGALPEEINRSFYVEMPNILQRNVPELVASLTNTTARIDPFGTDIKIKRFTLEQVLTWLGYPDPQAIVADIFPPGAENQAPPMPVSQDQAALAASTTVNPTTPATPADQLGVSGPFAGAPESLTSQQPYPGANTGVTYNNGNGLGA